MDFSATIDLIIKDLKEASDIIDDLKKYPGVPALQVELAKLKCRSAGECIAILKTLEETSSLVKREPVVQEKRAVESLFKDKVQNEPALQEKVQNEPVPQEKAQKESVIQEKVQKQPVIVENKPVQEPVIAPAAEEKRVEAASPETAHPSVAKEAEHKKIPVREQDSPILADKFSHVTNTFHDNLGIISSEDDLSVMLKSQPIDSLPDAIGINDKFLFIREIFKGNQVDYHQAISRLDNVENLTDAKAVIMSYTGGNDENEAVKQLLDLVKRKLPANE
jgi:hypothetical protein